MVSPEFTKEFLTFSFASKDTIATILFQKHSQGFEQHVSSKRIDLVEDDIPISDFMDKFQSQIYKYIKHSHRSRWQAL